MAKILLTSRPFNGEINPRLGIARQLVAMGHEVFWLLVPGDAAAQPELPGVRWLGLAGAPRGRMSAKERAEVDDDFEASLAFTRAGFIDSNGAVIDEVIDVLRSIRPDIVAGQGSVYAPIVAAGVVGVPYVNLSANLGSLQPDGFDSTINRVLALLDGARRALFARCPSPPTFKGLECLSPIANIVFTTEDFITDAATRLPTSRLVGPSISAEGRDDPALVLPDEDEDRPLIFVSFGSRVFWQPRLLGAFAEAAGAMNVRMMLSAGELATSAFAQHLPPLVSAHAYVPQLRVLERADVFVTHGGANSVMEAMYYGVPVIVIPLCNDQPVQAHFVERSGTGRWLEKADATPERAHALMTELLTNPTYRDRARRVRDSYRRTDGCKGAAEAIVAALASA